MKNTTQTLDETLIAFRHKMTTLLLNEAKDSKLSLSHFEILMHLAHKGEVTMKDIATWLNITPPSASTLIDVLVKKNLVTRVQSDNDRRTVHVTIKKEAYKLINEIHKKKMSIFKKILTKLSEEDKKDLVRILNKCIA